MLNIQLEEDRVHLGDRFSVTFQRTLRIPDDGNVYPLPPGFGEFPIRRVADYSSRAPADWDVERGVFIPMYQREALWLAFSGADWKPNAVQVAVGRVNALTGEPWENGLQADPQNYLVVPDQPWLDGIKTGEGTIRQFVAMPLGEGYTIEGQISGEEKAGGMQIRVYEPKPGRFPDQPPAEKDLPADIRSDMAFESVQVEQMGLSAGGEIVQKVYPDPYGIDTWDAENFGELFVYIVNSEQYQSLTGEAPPPTPVSAQTYNQYKLPWYELYDETAGDIAPSEKLAGVKSVKEKDHEAGIDAGEDETSLEVDPDQIKKLKRPDDREQVE